MPANLDSETQVKNIPLSRHSLFLLFLFALIPFFFFSAYLPKLKFFYFAPFVVISWYKLTLNKALWMGAFCGFFIDLFSSLGFGFHTLNYAITTLLLYPQRKHFFEDKFSTIPLMTFFFSLVSTLIQIMLFFFFGEDLFFSTKWLFTDLILMPILDACYAFIWFSLPFQLYFKLVNAWKKRKRS